VCVIGDVHVHPDHDSERLRWLGNMIVDLKPDEVWQTGDFSDLPSLSSYDKGKRSFEGRRYKRDVEATVAAQEILWGPLKEYNERQRTNKKAMYEPYRLMTIGNHSARIDKVTQSSPELYGAISMDDMQYDKYWHDLTPFKDRTVRHGFALSHYFASGIMGSPIGGVHAAHSLLTKLGMSAIAGHSHLYDEKIATRADGKKMMALVAGCYVHPDMVEGWNRDTAHMWYNGVVYMQGVKDGWAETVTRMSQDWIKRNYA
jgi:hypothetical protein